MVKCVSACRVILTAALGLPAVFLTATSVLAGSLQIAELGQDRVSVEVVDTSLDEVIDRLGQAYGFQVERIGDEQPREPMSGSFQGPLKSVLERMLQAENHIIQTSPRTASGVARVSLYSGAGVAQPTGSAQPQNAGSGAGGPQPLSRKAAPVAAVQPRAPVAQPYATVQPLAPTSVASAASARATAPSLRPQTTSSVPDPAQRPRRGGIVN